MLCWWGDTEGKRFVFESLVEVLTDYILVLCAVRSYDTYAKPAPLCCKNSQQVRETLVDTASWYHTSGIQYQHSLLRARSHHTM